MSEAQPVWTEPRTWRHRDKLTAAGLNVDLRDNLLWLKRYISREADITVTVGTDSDTDDYPDVSSALEALSRMRPIFTAAGPVAGEVLIRSGHTISEQVKVKGVDLSWVTIVSEDAEVPVDRSALTEEDAPEVNLSSRSAFFALYGALPTIGTVLNMDTSGTLDLTRLVRASYTSRVIILPDAGLKGGTERLLEVSHSSLGMARQASITDGAGYGVRLSNNSVLHAGAATISGNAQSNVSVAGGSTFNGNDADLTNAGEDGLRLTPGPGMIQASRADVSGAARYGLYVLHAGEVDFSEGTATGCGAHNVYVEGPGVVHAADATLDDAVEDAVNVRGGGAVVAPQVFARNAGSNAFNVDHGGRLSANGATATGAGSRAADIANGATASLPGSDLSGATDGGIRCNRMGHCNAFNTNARMGTSDDPGDIEVLNGSQIAAQNATGGLSQTANSVTSDGIIYQ